MATAAHSHPTPKTYWLTAVVLAVVTAVEIGIVYVSALDSVRGLLLILLGGIYLIVRNMMNWRIPVAILGTGSVFAAKDGTDIRVGDILTLEGGLGKSFMQGAASAGIAYYGQWKISEDDLGVDLPTLPNRRLGKHRVYGIGPELTVPLATKNTLYGFLNLRYFWETGARSTLQGNTFVATMSFPVPSIPLQ